MYKPDYDPDVRAADNPSPETRRGWIIAGAIFTVLAIAGALFQMYWLVSLRSGSDSKNYPGAISALAVSNMSSSDVQIIADESVDGARVDRSMNWSGTSSDKPDSTIAIVDGVLKIGDECAGTSNCSIDYRIYVSPDIKVDAETSSGDLDIRGTVGAVSANASSGDVRLTGIQGDVVVAANSGDVTLTDIEGDVDVKADSGDIRASGISAGIFNAHADSGDIRADLAKDANNIRVIASSGDIYLTVPGLTPYDVQASTGSGSTSVEIPIDNGSARPLVAKADSGDVRIDGN